MVLRLVRMGRVAAVAAMAILLVGGCGGGLARSVLPRETVGSFDSAQDATSAPAGRSTQEPPLGVGPTAAAGRQVASAAVTATVVLPTPEVATATAVPSPTATVEEKPIGVEVGLDALASFDSAQDAEPLRGLEGALQGDRKDRPYAQDNPFGAVVEALGAAGIDAAQVTEQADLRLTWGDENGTGAATTAGAVTVWERVFTPADRMSSVLQSITLDELEAVWTGDGTTPNFGNIYVGEEDVTTLAMLLGEPGENVIALPADEVEAAVWGDRMGLAIVPFERLNIRLRAIPVDGQTPVDNRFDAGKWPLTARASLAGLTERGRDALAKVAERQPVTNRDAAKLTVLVMTGVTAMARNSAVAIDRSGDPGFLARIVGPELAAADLTIISNEIPFLPDCVANNTLNNLILCSHNDYWENLALSGVDAIGLSGNHQNDFGYDAMRQSLAFYEEKGIPIYGGGENDEAARAALELEHNGNRLGFLGANQWGPEAYYNGKGEMVSAWAGEDHPGSARFDLPTMQEDIRSLKPRVDLVFAEVQHTEFNNAGNYQTEPIPLQEDDFRGMIDAGADVVTGVMAHAPQAVEIRDGRLILYGLGNLYFDQTWSWPTRTGLVARHTIYDGKLINTELLVTVIERNFQLRWATPEERVQVLRSVFDVSRWDGD